VTLFQPLLLRQELAVGGVEACRSSIRSFNLVTIPGAGGTTSLAIFVIMAQLMLSLRTTVDSSSRR